MSDDHKKKASDAPKSTLSEGDIETNHSVSRRNMLRGFGLGTLGLGSVAVAGCVPVSTTGVAVGSGYTDSDNGPIVDPGGFGRGPARAFATGITDADNGPIVDRVGFGRG